MIDYDRIISELNEDKIKNLLNQLQIPFQDKGTYLICKTACHNTDLTNASNKLYYYKDNKFFYCFTECGGMSIFTFLKNFYETRGINYDWYTDIYLVVLDCSNYNSSRAPLYVPIRDKYEVSQVKELKVVDDKVLDCFVKRYPIEWLEDGISREAMDKYNILYSISQNKIIIPHYNANGELVGIRGRALDPWEIENIGKYAPVKIENTWYSHPLSLNLYGLNLNKDNIKKSGVCFVFESEKSVLQLESFSGTNCGVAVCGSNFNKFALKLLLKEASPQEIVICFDSEEKSKEDTIYFNKLWKICSKYRNYCNFSFVYDKKDRLNLKDSPSDKGEKIFRELVEERVRIL